LKTDRSARLPGALEPPEGVLLGILAGQSRRIGAFRSVAGSRVENAYDLSPKDIDAHGSSPGTGLSLADRVSWFDFVPEGIHLQTDVTAVRHGNHRYGAVRRIMILIQRAAYRIGLDHVFEPGSERIWRTIKDGLVDLLHHIYLKNGLRGKSSQEAYAVTCGRSTMTQNDIDNGRLIANVTLQPAVPIEKIAVDVLVERDGAVSFGSDAV
jgi:phage tail sheath protein FI